MKKLLKFLGTGAMWVTLTFVGMLTFAAGLNIVHTAFPTADQSAEFGIPYALEQINTILSNNMTTQNVVANSTSAYQVPNNTAYTIFVAASNPVAVSMPSAANSLDSEEVVVVSEQAASATWAASAASVVGAPSTLAIGTGVKFKYNAAASTWYAVIQ